ncbi:GtrA family protein [Methylobacterium sp. ID0610]|uniref:GtrA family protein n=1 Tax=Methylobacterium carpenticola TaxID=3344827 RepID=UPI0036963191
MSRPPLAARAASLPPALRFLFAGGTAAALNWLARFPLSLVLPFWLAVWSAAAIGMVAGFVLYRSVVFPFSARPLHQEIRDFLAVNLVTSLVVTGLAELIRTALAPWWQGEAALAFAHAAAIAAGAVLNFLGHRSITFRPARPASLRGAPGPAHPGA